MITTGFGSGFSQFVFRHKASLYGGGIPKATAKVLRAATVTEANVPRCVRVALFTLFASGRPLKRATAETYKRSTAD